MKKLILLFILSLSFGLQAQNAKVQHVDAATFKKLVDDNEAVLIDLRTTEEIHAKGKIKGAMHIDYLAKNAESEIKKLDKDKIYLIYCAGGGRSGECAELMTKEGFKEIINLEKGFDDWKRKGFAVEDGK